MTDKVKLTGGLEKTVTWLWLDPETGGRLKVEYYDFSEDAQRMFGNDIAYTITVREMAKLFSTVGKDEVSLIPWIVEYFKSYFGIKQWLEENKIAFDVEIESHA
ncbi:MAG: hypothetical protein JNK32_04200 [Anaerolineales bacterium]|nr:hypothetical protein [Anaerolineales bacterium]